MTTIGPPAATGFGRSATTTVPDAGIAREVVLAVDVARRVSGYLVVA
jgi:hypothetical protein